MCSGQFVGFVICIFRRYVVINIENNYNSALNSIVQELKEYKPSWKAILS